jgi:site-specific DNA-methyltransferase (adenine-specific)
MIELFHDNNMNVMAKYPDGYFDLAIVDPPYGIGAADYKRGGTQHGNAAAKSKVYGSKDWDKSAPTGDYFAELKRVSKNQIVWGANHFISRIPYDSPSWIVWDKENGDNGYADCELAWTSFDTAVRRVRWKWHGMLQKDMTNKEERIHPTQKPVGLYKWLLDKYAKQGDKILDTHLGSGSIAIACHDMGFDLVACEIDKDYYEAAVKRFNENTKQLKLIA